MNEPIESVHGLSQYPFRVTLDLFRSNQLILNSFSSFILEETIRIVKEDFNFDPKAATLYISGDLRNVDIKVNHVEEFIKFILDLEDFGICNPEVKSKMVLISHSTDIQDIEFGLTSLVALVKDIIQKEFDRAINIVQSINSIHYSWEELQQNSIGSYIRRYTAKSNLVVKENYEGTNKILTLHYTSAKNLITLKTL